MAKLVCSLTWGAKEVKATKSFELARVRPLTVGIGTQGYAPNDKCAGRTVIP